jgi:hypothetical protein
MVASAAFGSKRGDGAGVVGVGLGVVGAGVGGEPVVGAEAAGAGLGAGTA